jgi:GMP synthase (glutamine-hydrolysing)
MILLVNLCSEPLQEYEFLRPLQKILEKENVKFKTVHFKEDYKKELKKASHVLLSGNSLLDSEHLKHLKLFSWIKDFDKALLGICAGAQVLAQVHELKIKKNIAIGQKELSLTKKGEEDPLFKNFKKEEKIYLLHQFGVRKSKKMNLLALDSKEVLAFSLQKDHYALLFHPEVRHAELIVNFINLK